MKFTLQLALYIKITTPNISIIQKTYRFNLFPFLHSCIDIYMHVAYKQFARITSQFFKLIIGIAIIYFYFPNRVFTSYPHSLYIYLSILRRCP